MHCGSSVELSKPLDVAWNVVWVKVFVCPIRDCSHLPHCHCIVPVVSVYLICIARQTADSGDSVHIVSIVGSKEERQVRDQAGLDTRGIEAAWRRMLSDIISG